MISYHQIAHLGPVLFHAVNALYTVLIHAVMHCTLYRFMLPCYVQHCSRLGEGPDPLDEMMEPLQPLSSCGLLPSEYPHIVLYTEQCTAVYDIECTVQSAQWTVQKSTVYNANCTLHSITFIVHSLQCTEYSK